MGNLPEWRGWRPGPQVNSAPKLTTDVQACVLRAPKRAQQGLEWRLWQFWSAWQASALAVCSCDAVRVPLLL